MLAHDAQNDRFEIISDGELMQILEETTGISGPDRLVDKVDESATGHVQADEQLELVSNSFLRKILNSADGGFSPYDSA